MPGISRSKLGIEVWIQVSGLQCHCLSTPSAVRTSVFHSSINQAFSTAELIHWGEITHKNSQWIGWVPASRTYNLLQFLFSWFFSKKSGLCLKIRFPFLRSRRCHRRVDAQGSLQTILGELSEGVVRYEIFLQCQWQKLEGEDAGVCKWWNAHKIWMTCLNESLWDTSRLPKTFMWKSQLTVEDPHTYCCLSNVLAKGLMHHLAIWSFSGPGIQPSQDKMFGPSLVKFRKFFEWTYIDS